MYCRWWYYSHLNSYFYVFHFEVFQRIVSLYYNVTLTISIKLLTAVPKHCYSDTATVSWKKIGWMCYRKQELFTLHEHLSSPYVFGGDHVNHLFFSFLFLYSLSSSCLVYSMLPVSLDCSFLIAPMVFCNTYFGTTIEYRYKDQWAYNKLPQWQSRQSILVDDKINI